MNNEVLLDKLGEFLMVEQCGWQLYRVVGEQANDLENVLLAETKLATLGLQAIVGQAPPDPDRLDACVVQPELKIEQVHAAPMDKRSLLETAQLPAAQPTPASRTSTSP